MTEKKKNKSRFFSFTIKVLLWLGAIVVLFILGVLGYVNLKKDEISKSLIGDVNTFLNGEINVGKIEIESLWTYPDINISIKDIEIYEANLEVRELGVKPVIAAPELLARVNFTEMFSGKLEVEFVEIRDAVVVIERTKDSEVTIGTTFIPVQQDTSSSDSIQFVLEIDSIHLINTQVLLTDASLKDTLPIRINEFSGDLTFAEGKVGGFADAVGYFEKFDISKNWTYTKEPLEFKVNYSVAIEEQKVYANSSDLFIANTPFKFDFVFDYASTSAFELNFGSQKKGIEIRSAFNPEDSIDKPEFVYLKNCLTH